ncbi:hypothetical protein [Streptomyces millisiae]|uniref:Uncharacterized protein n=1 Tax=Streptomyces millisiae TaxID=3075542 RepID=A0ABU2LNW2_9ACTN|nr:hypothetical protein [Streptomyces sp. DSM 44918]MDT0319286.1 hypothetical protein [Streptomyces sp. DSM 44918]
MTPADDSVATTRRVGVGLRASLQCWCCGESEEPLANSGEVVGELGTVPLFCCPDCARRLEWLYRAALGQVAPEAPC